MGAWGMKAYENDGAGDFCAELSESDDPLAMLMAALTDLDNDYIEIDEAQQAVMAAAIIVHWSGGSADQIGEFHKDQIESVKTANAKTLIGPALAALDKVESDADTSELFELWEEAEDFDEWRAEMAALKRELQTLA